MNIMNVVEKRDFIHNHLHKVNEPAIDEMYKKMLSLLNEFLVEESEEDIKNGDLISQEALKKESQNWRTTK